MILDRCVSTVLTVIPNSAAISLFVFPSARRRMISISRGVVRAPARSLLLVLASRFEKSIQHDFGHFGR